MKQIALPFLITPQYSLDNFFVYDNNISPLKTLLNPQSWGCNVLVIQGEKSAGKTHLAHIYATHFDVPLYQGKDFLGTDILELEHNGGVIDNIDAGDENLFFHAINATKEHSQNLVVTTTQPVRDFVLPDLASRLSQAFKIIIDLPTDNVLSMVILKHFSDRSLNISPDIIEYILKYAPRSFAEIAYIIEKIDDLSLQNKQNITKPLIRSILENLD